MSIINYIQENPELSVSSLNRNLTKTSSSNNTSSFSDVLNSVSNPLNAPKKLEPYFQEAAKKYNVDINLLKAIAKTESNFNANAVSSAGASGVMQLMPSTAKSLGVNNSFDAQQNIMGGAKLIAAHLKKYNGNAALALAAYNAGGGAVDKYNGVPPYKETQNYIKKVLTYYAQAANGEVSDTTYSNSSAASNNVTPLTANISPQPLQNNTDISSANTSYTDTNINLGDSAARALTNTISSASVSNLLQSLLQYIQQIQSKLSVSSSEEADSNSLYTSYTSNDYADFVDSYLRIFSDFGKTDAEKESESLYNTDNLLSLSSLYDFEKNSISSYSPSILNLMQSSYALSDDNKDTI